MNPILKYSEDCNSSYDIYGQLGQINDNNETSYLLKATSEPSVNCPTLLENNFNKMHLMVNTPTEQPRIKNPRKLSRQLKVPDSELINPKLIPKMVQKSLIDLHKKSVQHLNRAQSPLSKKKPLDQYSLGTSITTYNATSHSSQGINNVDNNHCFNNN